MLAVFLTLLTLLTVPAERLLLDSTICVVNGRVLYQSDLLFISRMSPEIRRALAPLSIEWSEGLDGLIERTLILQEMRRLGFDMVPEKDVTDGYEGFLGRLEGKESLETFEKTFGFNRDDFLQYLQEEIVIEKFLQVKFQPFIRITQDELADFLTQLPVPYDDLTYLQQEAVRDEARSTLITRKIAERLKTWLKETREAAKINILPSSAS